MLSKLLKHEFMATGRMMWVIYAAMASLSVGANFSIRYLSRGTSKILEALMIALLILWGLSLVIGMVATVVLMVRQFYKNLLTDEGYLMFTLPGTVHQLVLSKIITAAVWTVTSIAVLMLCGLIAAFNSSFFKDLTDLLRMLAEYNALNSTVILLEVVVVLFLSCAASCLQFYSAMSIGHGFTNHKILWSVVAYFIQYTVLQILGVIVMVVLVGSAGSSDAAVATQLTPMKMTHLTMLITGGVELLLSAVFYVITVVNLQKRLNLA